MDFKTKYREFFDQLDSEYFDEERFVPAVGPEDADVMFVGEAPGANEVEEGEPFVGRAGEKMNKLLNDVGVERDEIYITNLVKIRPPENRDPKKDEIEAWKPLLEKEIEEVDPDKIVPLGNFASKELADTSKGITSIHGKKFYRNDREVIPLFHPAATLYDQSKTPDLRNDLRKIFGKRKSGQKSLKDI